MSIRWTRTAQAALEAYLDRLHMAGGVMRQEAQEEFRTMLTRLEQRPLMARPSRWPGLREWSFLRWKKIVVLRVEGNDLVVLAFLDVCQDLSRIIPDDD